MKDKVLWFLRGEVKERTAYCPMCDRETHQREARLVLDYKGLEAWDCLKCDYTTMEEVSE